MNRIVRLIERDPTPDAVSVRVEIGRVQDSDLEAIGKLHAHFWGEVSNVKAMAETLDRLDTNPDCILLSARIDGECVGTATGAVCYGLYGGSDSYLVIEDVVVDPHHRRHGVASALIGELEHFARERSCNQMILLTETCRDDAAALYRAAGFAARWTGFKKKLRDGADAKQASLGGEQAQRAPGDEG